MKASKRKITIKDFKILPMTVHDAWNYEFNQVYGKLFDSEFRTVYLPIPSDLDRNLVRITYIFDVKDVFQEFTTIRGRYIKCICQRDNWDGIEEITFQYPFLSDKLLEIRDKINELEVEYNNVEKSILETFSK